MADLDKTKVIELAEVIYNYMHNDNNLWRHASLSRMPFGMRSEHTQDKYYSLAEEVLKFMKNES